MAKTFHNRLTPCFPRFVLYEPHGNIRRNIRIKKNEVIRVNFGIFVNDGNTGWKSIEAPSVF